MTTATRYTINDIQEEMRADGSNYWWNPDTMRFFGTRICGPVFQGDGGIYFATSEHNYDKTARLYSVRKYDPETKQIDTVDAAGSNATLGEFSSRQAAIRCASRLAGPNATADGTPLDRVTPRDQFIYDCRRHGNPKASKADCDSLRRMGKRHSAMMVDACNGREFFDSEGNPAAALVRVRDKLTALARRVGAKGIAFSGDPRGCTVKLQWANGETNDFGSVGWCVPGA